MRYMVSIMQPMDIKLLAEELRVPYNLLNKLYDIPDELKDKKYNIYISKQFQEKDIDWDSIAGLASQLNVVVCLEDAVLAHAALEHELKWYWALPCTSWFELYGLINNKASEVFINGPLFFDLPKLSTICKEHNIQIRAVPNKAYDYYIPRDNGICGTYIRPEDVVIYEKYIDTLEFVSANLTQEANLFDIYKVKGFWNGNLRLLIINLNKDVNNRGFDNRFAERRLSCKQQCLKTNCKFCNLFFDFIRLTDERNTKKWLLEAQLEKKE